MEDTWGELPIERSHGFETSLKAGFTPAQFLACSFILVENVEFPKLLMLFLGKRIRLPWTMKLLIMDVMESRTPSNQSTHPLSIPHSSLNDLILLIIDTISPCSSFFACLKCLLVVPRETWFALTVNHPFHVVHEPTLRRYLLFRTFTIAHIITNQQSTTYWRLCDDIQPTPQPIHSYMNTNDITT